MLRIVQSLAAPNCVQIYEQSRFGRELGAAVHMAPNAHGLFHKLGIDLAATGANEVQIVGTPKPISVPP